MEIALSQVRETAAMIAPYLVRTPVHVWRSRETSSLLGEASEVVLKLELFQHTGTFKARGALSQMLRLSPEQRRHGVTAVSAGNHAVAVAHVAAMLGIDAKLVMVKTANAARLAAARASGAEIILAENGQAAFAMAEELVEREQRFFVHPFEGPNVTLGTATLGLEFLEQAGPLDALIVSVGGGGLASGVSAAAKLVQPSCRVYGVEPAGAALMHRSFAAGAPQRSHDIATIADSLAPPMTLPYSFAVCRDNLDELVLVDDSDLRGAMGLLFRELKFAVEPACAAGIAALTGPLRGALQGQRVGVVMCGSNIDLESFTKLLLDRPAS